MKLLLYGVNKETVTKEDADKYKLTQEKKEKQMHDIFNLEGIEEIVVLENGFRNEYYLYVDEHVFSHGDFLRYLSEQTGKSLEEIILETYSKFNEDVLHHLYEIASGYIMDAKGCFKILESIKKALDFAEKLQTTEEVLVNLFSGALELAYSLKLESDLQPLNDNSVSKLIYLLKKEMGILADKNYVLAGPDLEIIILAKILLLADAQTVTLTNRSEKRLEKTYDKLKRNLTDSEITKVRTAEISALDYRLAKADAIVLDVDEFDLGNKSLQENVAAIRQTEKVQYILDTNPNPIEELVVEGLSVQLIDSDVKFSYNEEEKEQAIIVFEEILSSQIEKYMEYFEQFQTENITEPSY